MKPTSFIRQRPFRPAAAVLAALTVCHAHAALIAEERFDYPDGTNIVGANGGTGFSGGWIASPGGSSNFVTDTTGRAYATGATESRHFRELSAPVDLSTGTGSFYMSFLMSKSTIDSGAGFDVVGLSLYSGTSTELLYFVTRDAAFRLGGSNLTVVTSSNLYTPANATFSMVLEVVYNGTDHTMNGYVFNDGQFPDELPSTPTLTSTGTLGSFDTIRILKNGFNGSATLDDIRLGTTYADVIPEPSSSLFALLGGFGLLTLRRRA